MKLGSSDDNAALKYDPEFYGPVHRRHCTDLPCLFVFIFFISTWIVLAIVAIRFGDPELVIFPSDSYGRICGRGDLSDKPNLYFFNIFQCTKLSSLSNGCDTKQICVSTCPNYTVSFIRYRNEAAYNALTYDEKLDIANKLICDYNVTFFLENIPFLLKNKLCGLNYLESKPIAGRCVPALKNRMQNINETLKQFEDGSQHIDSKNITKILRNLINVLNIPSLIGKVCQDLSKVWQHLIIALLFAMVISFGYIVLLRIIAGIMVWFSMFAILALSCLALYFCINQFVIVSNLTDEQLDPDLREDLVFDFSTIIRQELDSYLNNKMTWIVLSIIFGSIAILLSLTFLFLRKRVSIAISLIKEASKAICHSQCSLLFPIIPYIFQVLSIIFGVFIAIMISALKKETYRIKGGKDSLSIGLTCDPFTYHADDNSRCVKYSIASSKICDYAQFYNIFIILWLLFFIRGMCQIIFAGAFASYYWAFNKSRDVPTFPLLQSSYRAIRYHMGSIAFGSLLLTFIRLLRMVCEYIDKKCRKYSDNAFFKSIMCLCKCFLWIWEKFLKFLTTNAYIMVAIHGKGFYNSAKNAFFLLLRNVLRVAVIDEVADYLLFLGKLVVTAILGSFAYFYFSGSIPIQIFKVPELNYIWTPIIAICICTFLISSSFFTVYHMAVDTIFLCFLEDCERNDGSPSKPYYMSKRLKEILQYKNKVPTPI